MAQNKKPYEKNTITPMAVAIGAISTVAVSMGLGLINYISFRNEFRKEVTHNIQLAYQKQRDNNEDINIQKALEDSQVYNEPLHRFTKTAKRIWGIAGSLTGGLVGGLTVALAAGAIVALGIANPAVSIFAIGAAAAVLGSVIVGTLSYKIAANHVTKEAEDYIANALIDKENQKGLDKERITSEQTELNRGKYRIIANADLKHMQAQEKEEKNPSTIVATNDNNKHHQAAEEAKQTHNWQHTLKQQEEQQSTDRPRQ